MLQPLKLNVINKDGKTTLLMFDIKNLEPYLFTMNGEPVEMIIRDDALYFRTDETDYKAINPFNITAEQQYNKFLDIIKLRLDALKGAAKYLEREKDMELLKNETLKEYKNKKEMF